MCGRRGGSAQGEADDEEARGEEGEEENGADGPGEGEWASAGLGSGLCFLFEGKGVGDWVPIDVGGGLGGVLDGGCVIALGGDDGGRGCSWCWFGEEILEAEWAGRRIRNQHAQDDEGPHERAPGGGNPAAENFEENPDERGEDGGLEGEVQQ